LERWLAHKIEKGVRRHFVIRIAPVDAIAAKKTTVADTELGPLLDLTSLLSR
jgi:hypothetical protein